MQTCKAIYRSAMAGIGVVRASRFNFIYGRGAMVDYCAWYDVRGSMFDGRDAVVDC